MHIISDAHGLRMQLSSTQNYNLLQCPTVCQ